MEDSSHYCSICPFFTNNQSQLLKHLILKHRNAENFRVHCKVDGCCASFKSINSFRSHVHRNLHVAVPVLDVDVANAGDDDHEHHDDELENDENGGDLSSIQLGASYYMLKLNAKFHLPETALTAIRTTTEYLIQQQQELIKASLKTKLTEEEISSIFEDDIYQPVFSGLNSRYLLDKSWKENFNLIEPICITLDEVFANQRVRKSCTSKRQPYRLKKKKVVGYCVPFLDSLQALLITPHVSKYIMTHSIQDFGADFKTDVFDGDYFQNHEYIRRYPQALTFAIYLDDFEIVNPIGSHRTKHKLTAFYYILLNIPPHLRTKLEAIQLIGILKTLHLKKYGMGEILNDLIGSFNRLFDGVNLNVLTPNGEKANRKFYGILAYILGDTPAAQLIGGFKEGVGGAFKPCRTCEIERSQLNTNSVLAPSNERDENEHRERCENLESGLTSVTRKYWSKQYGVNGRSALFDIPGVEVTHQILHDPMHVLLEGIVPLETKLLLSHCLECKFFSLLDLNKIIQNFEYSQIESKDLPLPIKENNLQSKVKLQQTAQSMKNFMTLLPFMVGDYIAQDDEHWHTYMQLIQITLLTMSSVSSSRLILTLTQLIANHHASFRRLYPQQNCPPKMHYLSHFPTQIQEFGPGRNHSCMRFESKHGETKAKKYKNFKRISKSVAFQHQKKMCLAQHNEDGSPSSSYLSSDDIIKIGYQIDISNTPYYKNLVEREYGASSTDVPDVHVACMSTSEVTFHGHTYMKGTVLVQEWNSGDYPLLIRIDQIITVRQAIYLVCKVLNVECFLPHYNAFAITETAGADIIVLKPLDLPYKWPQICHQNRVMLQNVDDAWQL